MSEATLEETGHGLVCKSDGWFVVNARQIRWYESEGYREILPIRQEASTGSLVLVEGYDSP